MDKNIEFSGKIIGGIALQIKTNREISKFVDSLSKAEQTPNTFNQYAAYTPENLVRINNLKLYLTQMYALQAKVLLVGEAAGYHGCRFTGIPFTSEYILLKGLEDIDLFGIEKGYEKTAELDTIKKEQSATIVWETISRQKFVPLIWNAFPFHPFKKDNPTKNRTPLKKELDIGAEFLLELINIFDIETIVALGNKAEQTLNKINIECVKVRHPAQGGKADFVKGIEDLVM